MTTREITDADVRELLQKSLLSGDQDMMHTCEDALGGCEQAWCDCVHVIRDAQRKAQAYPG